MKEHYRVREVLVLFGTEYAVDELMPHKILFWLEPKWVELYRYTNREYAVARYHELVTYRDNPNKV